MKQLIFPSSIETARALILRVIELMAEEPNRTFHIAFSGGSTPALMFDLWSNEYCEITPWERLMVYWVDERCVPPENSDSNYGMMRSLLLSASPIPCQNVFRICGESKSPEKEAIRYSQLIENQLPYQAGNPIFDVVILGAGEDGHTSSIFPGQEAMLSSSNIYEVSCNPNNGQKRIALTGLTILNANLVLFLIMGKNKANVVHEICDLGDTGPAAYIAHHAKNVELYIDEMAALQCDKHN